MQPRAAATDQRINGVVIGIVEKVVDDPDKTNRVEVSLPWYASGYRAWARVVQPYAGADYGCTWTPEKDSEVLVAFAHGDMRFPYVLGALHSPVDAPPTTRTSSSDVKTLLTPSGLELRFDEQNGTVTVRAGDRASITLDAAGTISIDAADTLSLNAATVEITGTSEVKVSGGTIKLN